LVSEVLLGRYTLPEAKVQGSRLARHEAGVWGEVRQLVDSLGRGSHRDKEFNANILPHCRALVEATGRRMAYDAAASSDKVTPEALALFESTCIMSDLSWYCDNENISRKELFAHDAFAASKALPQLQEMLDQTEAAEWTSVPILSDDLWDDFVQRLPIFSYQGLDPAE
jgi:acyl-CoA oxidase